MIKQQIKSLYTNLVSDPDFDRLDLGLHNPNIFQVLKIATKEGRHSNFIAWILDPGGNHNLGNLFLKRFLRRVFASTKFNKVSAIDVEAFSLDQVQVQREWKNIDILISSDEFVVCIENKIFSKEHSNQLHRYKSTIEGAFPNHIKTYVYLSPEGIPSESESDSFEPVSYEFLVDLIDRVLTVHSDTFDEKVKTYLRDYAVTVRRDIMKNDELIDLAQKNYKNHKEVFDFVIENRPDFVSRVHDLFSASVLSRGWALGSESKYYIRFSTPKVAELIYFNTTVKNGWRNAESFQFEIGLNVARNKVTFKTVIAPSDPKYDVSELERILLEIEGSKASRGLQWLVNFSISSKFDYEESEAASDQEVTEQITRFLDKIARTVEAVELKFVENQDRLLELKRLAST